MSSFGCSPRSICFLLCCFVLCHVTESSPSTVVCDLDACKDLTASLEYCDNGGTCMLDISSCTNYCLCPEGYVGSRCDAMAQVPGSMGASGDTAQGQLESQEPLPPLEIRKCSDFFVCQYGICETNGWMKRCVCLDGWEGVLCESRVQEAATTTNAPVGNNKTASDNDPGTTAPLVLTTRDPRYNVCSEEPLQRTPEEQKCLPNLRCKYGVCKKMPYSEGGTTGFAFECQCDLGARGHQCEHRCCLECGSHGACQLANDTDATYCDCHRHYAGDVCEIYSPPPSDENVHEVTWYLWVVGSCAVAMLLLILLLACLPYLMWKHRVILIMKIVHYFQPYEDEDHKQWDAFVSYKSDTVDENFVVHNLYPKLERELGFKLCLHFRDFVPGETIANNIINAVEDSRRTILILTPRYIESEFTRFEYQKAQHEMLQRKHRIIPLVLEDISTAKVEMDKNLKGIIESVTYLEWPGDDCQKRQDKFWKRLQLSLPKKKAPSVITETNLSAVENHEHETTTENIYSEIVLEEEKIPELSPEEEGVFDVTTDVCAQDIDDAPPPYICPESAPDVQVVFPPETLKFVTENEETVKTGRDNNLVLRLEDLKLRPDSPPCNVWQERTLQDKVTNGHIQEYLDLLEKGIDV